MIMLQFYIYYSNNNLKFISEEDKTRLMHVLEIHEANSFYPIYKKYSHGFHGSDPDYYEIKFEISIEDFEKNDLVYYEEAYYETLVDCHYKERKDDTTYTCIVKASNRDNQELFEKIGNYKKYANTNDKEIISNTNQYRYKHFILSFDNGFDRFKNMEYQDKIYHLVIDNYEEYLKFKNNNNDVLEMSEEDFAKHFMLITDIENTSMLGLTLQNFYNNENELMIELNRFPEGTKYDENKSAISMIIPRDMKRDVVLIKDMREDSNHHWKNTATKGLTKITEEQAIETAINYAEELENSESLAGKFLKNYNKVFQVTLTKCKPNNYWTITEGIIERNLSIANFERDAYEVILVSEEDELEIMRAFFYVDAYTNTVIAGREMAD